MNYFERLEIAEWQQFRSIDLYFHDRLTILTGANASGKTTLLNLLARHTNSWDVPSLAVPRASALEGIVRFFTRLFGGEIKSGDHIGTLTYSNGTQARLVVPQTTSANY